MWRDHATDSPSAYVFSLAGLFPAPLSDEAAATASGQRRLKMFGLLGQFVAKALMDSRIVDISLSRIFARLVLGYEVPLTIRSVRAIDRSLASSLEHLQAYVDAKAAILAEGGGRDELKRKLNEVKVDCATLDELALDFVLPGYDVELRPGSAGEPVTMDNVEEYVRLVIEWSLVKGVAQQIDAFKRGFSTIFPVKDLQSFTPEEVVNILGNTENEDWAEDSASCIAVPCVSPSAERIARSNHGEHQAGPRLQRRLAGSQGPGLDHVDLRRIGSPDLPPVHHRSVLARRVAGTAGG